ncbi:bifunctional ADP-dependent NAD(P)H-hydrate dehydratase/NAD(P)H-hydrate epimerase [Aestuariimicrobium kwangyangense]|uniref:bifunctional ADP-dependent NAD(P)H-hydrate dehydratase/NAD(P)H-hydrate epimerase n=1 Tax=Aestuariimicrobium kwangyangense TaxID=396389 RepID=UPI0003B6EFCB|nr:bifunctional ADP-dependent NAD(P)H-hydrate dehydratase/NAD(P)H-hydrate epimerase [Aestuariimicrobium kwangyangense]
MRPICSAESIRSAEHGWFAAHPGGDLFRPAVTALTEVARSMLVGLPHGFVLVVSGPGNNGEDARRTGRALAAEGVEVRHWDDEAETFAPNSEHWSHLVLVIDGFTGIGGRGGLPDHVRALAVHCARRHVAVLSVDLPSGLVADSGAEHPSFRATTTVTFVAEKPCHVLQPAASRCGRVVVADIGVRVPERVAHAVEHSDLAEHWPVPGVRSDKYSRGVVGLDTGSDQYPGAGLLGCDGALFSGAGMIRHNGPQRVTDEVVRRHPSVTVGEGRVQAWVVGSGWPVSDGHDLAEAVARLGRRAADRVPMVVDAGAISSEVLGELGEGLPPGSLLTPHAGELAGLLGVARQTVESDPLAHAHEAARQTGATVLLKGATQVCVTPDGQALVAVAGPAWTAQAGSGDVLAGVCGTLLAAGLTPLWAGALAASLQALTAEDHPGPWPPDRLAQWFPETIARLTHR